MLGVLGRESPPSRAAGLQEPPPTANRWERPRTNEVFDPDDDIEYPSYRLPAIAKLGPESLLAFAEARFGAKDGGPSDILVKRSDDHGTTWSLDPTRVVTNQYGVPGVNPHSNGYSTYGNPTPISIAPAADDPDGLGEVLLLFTVNETWVYQTRSSDGVTWSNPQNVSAQVAMPGWGRIATSPGHGLQIKHGAHRGRLLAPFSHMSSDSAVVQRQLWRTDPADRRKVVAVETSFEIDNPNAEPSHSHAAGGAAHHFAQRDHTEDSVVDLEPEGWAGLGAFEALASFAGALYSDDMGVTWHPGVSMPALGSHTHMMAEMPSGEIVSSYGSYSVHGSRCRSFAVSTDGGVTWALRAQAGAESSDTCAVQGSEAQGSLAAVGSWLYALAPFAAGPNEPTRHALGLYASPDGGFSWKQVSRPIGAGRGAYNDAITWPPYGVEPWPEIAILYEHGPAGSSAISLTRALLGNE